jgi:hypothetical protein
MPAQDASLGGRSNVPDADGVVTEGESATQIRKGMGTRMTPRRQHKMIDEQYIFTLIRKLVGRHPGAVLTGT